MTGGENELYSEDHGEIVGRPPVETTNVSGKSTGECHMWKGHQRDNEWNKRWLHIKKNIQVDEMEISSSLSSVSIGIWRHTTMTPQTTD